MIKAKLKDVCFMYVCMYVCPVFICSYKKPSPTGDTWELVSFAIGLLLPTSLLSLSFAYAILYIFIFYIHMYSRRTVALFVCAHSTVKI